MSEWQESIKRKAAKIEYFIAANTGQFRNMIF